MYLELASLPMNVLSILIKAKFQTSRQQEIFLFCWNSLETSWCMHLPLSETLSLCMVINKLQRKFLEENIPLYILSTHRTLNTTKNGNLQNEFCVLFTVFCSFFSVKQ